MLYTCTGTRYCWLWMLYTRKIYYIVYVMYIVFENPTSRAAPRLTFISSYYTGVMRLLVINTSDYSPTCVLRFNNNYVGSHPSLFRMRLYYVGIIGCLNTNIIIYSKSKQDKNNIARCVIAKLRNFHTRIQCWAS